MGTVIIIEEADFSENAVEQIPLENFISTRLSDYFCFYMDYEGTSAIRQLKTNSSGSVLKLYVADVSDYVGKTIQITAATPYTEGAKHACFSSDLGGFTFDQIKSLGSIPSSQHGVMLATPIQTIESFTFSSAMGVKTTLTKVIPQGAKYLLLTADYSQGFTDNELSVEIVNAS